MSVSSSLIQGTIKTRSESSKGKEYNGVTEIYFNGKGVKTSTKITS